MMTLVSSTKRITLDNTSGVACGLTDVGQPCGWRRRPFVLLRRTATSRPPSSRASVTSRHSSSTASERRRPPMKSSPTMTRSTAPRSAASSVDSRPPRPVGRREDGRQVSRPSRVRPDRAGRIRFAGQPDAEPSRRDRHRGVRGADGYPGGSRSTRRGGSPGSSHRADCRGARRV